MLGRGRDPTVDDAQITCCVLVGSACARCAVLRSPQARCRGRSVRRSVLGCDRGVGTGK